MKRLKFSEYRLLRLLISFEIRNCIKKRGVDGIDRWFIRQEDVALYCAGLAIFHMLQQKAKEQPVEEGIPL
jgi:hypothetical protein